MSAIVVYGNGYYDEWSRVFSPIGDIAGKKTLLTTWLKLSHNSTLPIHHHSKSCNNINPLWESAVELNNAIYNVERCRKDEWKISGLIVIYLSLKIPLENYAATTSLGRYGLT